ncbi:MAG: hypothetical protein FRX48_00739 [Lasallia pustulata]|uniref:Uncharacterized protein n=1 Tax=Lasallia pustulata TaxID=136370 RepID=A0A5M8Q3M9_9LECA|nr:MAG: hypothetical protein FRX48_00739 [Lasallia pustulata]
MERPTTNYPTEGVIKAPATYPPVLESVEILGYVTDRNGIGYSRDIGRSSTFAGRCYYVFGDTFCKDKDGDFVGLQSNTAAIVKSPAEPLNSEYLSIQKDGLVDALIPLIGEEHRFYKDPRFWKDPEWRVTLWPFGGIVETSPGLGWIWYEKGMEHLNDGNMPRGVGVARVHVDLASGKLHALRTETLLFGVDEPRVGGFSSVLHEEHIYLWGHHGKDVVLARVPKDSPWQRDKYSFWDGEGYVPWWQAAVPVVKDVQHGAIIKSSLFGKDRPWVFIGCTKWLDSMVMIGAAASLEGPWELIPLFKATGIDYPQLKMYCMYPHQWAFAEEDGELMVTWSEEWPGNVVAAKLKFQQGDNPTYWKRVSINEAPHKTRYDLMKKHAAAIAAYSGVNISPEGRWIAPGFAPPEGVMPLHLRIEGSDLESVIEGETLVKAQMDRDLQISIPPQSLTPPTSPTSSPGARSRRPSNFGSALKRLFSRGSSSTSGQPSPISTSSPDQETRSSMTFHAVLY